MHETIILGSILKLLRRRRSSSSNGTIRTCVYGALFTEMADLLKVMNGTNGGIEMKKIELEISENLFDRMLAIAKKSGTPEMSDEVIALDLLIDGIIENEKILKMLEDK